MQIPGLASCGKTCRTVGKMARLVTSSPTAAATLPPAKHSPLHETLSLRVPEDSTLPSGALCDQAPSTIDACSHSSQFVDPKWSLLQKQLRK